MKAWWMAGCLLCLLAGCAAGPSGPLAVATPSAPLEAGFAGGRLKLVFDAQGRWLSVSSTATVPMLSALPGAGEEALTVAEMKARRQIAEFLQVEVASRRSVTVLSQTLQSQQPQAPADGAVDEEASPSSVSAGIARRLSERLVQSSRAMLRGTVLAGSQLDVANRQAVVTVRVDRQSLSAATGLQQDLAGAP
ncbi:hypothetical protein THUN1379_24650 [Paludibacterium sp. THUN1379]|uniref:hypothetical protein n=1 Tax=Paludibacterium sp. THUN1379 TaxID=3112107 RepID=UPI00308D4A67|nr:hypothetical protein THUN1379_24650 [Paludibacterium sp. THUN1379]